MWIHQSSINLDTNTKYQSKLCQINLIKVLKKTFMKCTGTFITSQFGVLTCFWSNPWYTKVFVEFHQLFLLIRHTRYRKGKLLKRKIKFLLMNRLGLVSGRFSIGFAKEWFRSYDIIHRMQFFSEEKIHLTLFMSYWTRKI